MLIKRKIDFIEVLKNWGIGEANSPEFGTPANSAILREGLKNNNFYYLKPLLSKRPQFITYLYNLNLKWSYIPFNFIFENFNKISTLNNNDWHVVTNGTFKIIDALNYYLNSKDENRVKSILKNFSQLTKEDFSGIIIIKRNPRNYMIYEGHARLIAIYKLHYEKANLDFLKAITIIIGLPT